VTVPAIRERVVAQLRNASEPLARQVAEGLGMKEMPAPLPKALETPAKPEVRLSPALSMTARPGDGSIKARKIAILVGNGSVGKSTAAIHAELLARGAVPRFVAPRIGPVQTSDGVAIDADASMENEPGFLFDALVLADGEAGVATLKKDGHTMEFIKDQYRHGKTIMAIGAAKALLDKAEVSPALPGGKPDSGVIVASAGASEAITDFVKAVAMHRHPERETDSPMV
jgi:catalase